MDNDPMLEQPVNLPEDQTGGHLPQTPVYRPKTKNRKWIIIGVAVVTATLGLGYFVLNSSDKPPKSSNQAENTNQPSPSPEPRPDVPVVTETKVYENGPLGVTLTHPANWQVKDGTNKGIRIESPDFTYETADQKQQTGNFRIYIRKGARAQDSKYIGRGVALDNSQKLTYSKPTVGQRSDTLLSLFGLDEPQSFNYFFVAGNFQLKKGDTLGPDYGKEPETYIIAGGYSAATNEEDMNFVSVDAAYITDSNAYKQALDIIKSLELY
jgi:hypothetical protein